jgi:hypothetical protein
MNDCLVIIFLFYPSVDAGQDVKLNQYVHEDCKKDYCYDCLKKRKFPDATNNVIRSPENKEGKNWK